MPLQLILSNITSNNVKIHYVDSTHNNYECITERHTNGINEIVVTKVIPDFFIIKKASFVGGFKVVYY